MKPYPDEKETAALLARWLAVWRQLDKAYEDLRALTGAEPESALARAIWSGFEAYTDLLAEAVGDEDEWLDWFIWENGAGAKQMTAKAPSWDKPRVIWDGHSLAALVVACRRKEAL